MSNISVWFVEDDLNDIFLIQRALARTGLPVTARFAQHEHQLKAMFLVGEANGVQPDVVFTDLKLVGHDGFGILAWIKSHPKWHSIPVIVFTSSDIAEDRERALSLGAHAFIVKISAGPDLNQLLADVLRPFVTRNSPILPDARRIAGHQAEIAPEQ